MVHSFLVHHTNTPITVKAGSWVELGIHKLVGHFNVHASGLREVEIDEITSQEVEKREDEEHVGVADAVADEREDECGDKVCEEQQPVGNCVGAGSDVVRSDLIEQEVADGPQTKLKAHTWGFKSRPKNSKYEMNR